MNSRFFILLTALVALNCSRNKERNDFITAIKQTGKLVTAEYTLSKIIKANDNKTWYKIGDRKIVMSCEAYVKAGIDLRGITEKNITQNDSTLTIKLPHAEIFSLSIPADKIQLQYQSVNLLRDPFSAADREALLAQAQVQIQQLADSLGILQTAEENATVFIQKLLQSATAKNVTVLYN
jgi:hypothetical protein